MQVQNLKPEACYKVLVHDEESAKAVLRDIIKYLGLGFHPDTPASKYVQVVSGEKTFEAFEAETLDKNIELICKILPDVYDTSLGLWHEMGMITTDEYLEGGNF